jgi:hypothetical protein
MAKKTEKELREFYENVQKRQRRQTAKSLILMRKAREAGITVTEAEIDAYIKAHSVK